MYFLRVSPMISSFASYGTTLTKVALNFAWKRTSLDEWHTRRVSAVHQSPRFSMLVADHLNEEYNNVRNMTTIKCARSASANANADGALHKKASDAARVPQTETRISMNLALI